MGLEPMTLRLKVSCSTNWASQALCHKFPEWKNLKQILQPCDQDLIAHPKKLLISSLKSTPSLQKPFAGCLNRQLFKGKVCAPNVGLEPTTLRLIVSCSTDWASRPTYQKKKPFLQKPPTSSNLQHITNTTKQYGPWINLVASVT